MRGGSSNVRHSVKSDVSWGYVRLGAGCAETGDDARPEITVHAMASAVAGVTRGVGRNRMGENVRPGVARARVTPTQRSAGRAGEQISGRGHRRHAIFRSPDPTSRNTMPPMIAITAVSTKADE